MQNLLINGATLPIDTDLLRRQAAVVGRMISKLAGERLAGCKNSEEIELLEGTWEFLHRILDEALEKKR